MGAGMTENHRTPKSRWWLRVHTGFLYLPVLPGKRSRSINSQSFERAFHVGPAPVTRGTFTPTAPIATPRFTPPGVDADAQEASTVLAGRALARPPRGRCLEISWATSPASCVACRRKRRWSCSPSASRREEGGIGMGSVERGWVFTS